ncbi:hypothetical protein TRVL_09645 [Trypanosoma vivax]|nr:hypothetical protein TRVL_09645 [Trypanosoma vivax]
MVCSRRRAGVVHLVKIHDLAMERKLALNKKARRAQLTCRNGYTCRVCGGDFEQRRPLVEGMAPHPPGVAPTVVECPKRASKEDTPDDGNTLKCPWCAKKCTRHAFLRNSVVQIRMEKRLSSGLRTVRTHLLAMARQSRRNMSRRNLYAGSVIASSRARRGPAGTSAKQPPS